VQNQKGKFIRDLNNKLAYKRQPRQTLIYIIICETKPQRSVIIALLKLLTFILELLKTFNKAANSILKIYAKSINKQDNSALKRK
jgi:hypothetical protein